MIINLVTRVDVIMAKRVDKIVLTTKYSIFSVWNQMEWKVPHNGFVSK